MKDDIANLKDSEKEMRDDAPRRHSNNNWVAGLILIAIGAIFLITNVTGFRLDNWWALFILIPAVINLSNAWRSYQQHGRFTQAVRGPAVGGLILTLVAAVFLFSLDWGLIWPLFLIIIGVGALLAGWAGEHG